MTERHISTPLGHLRLIAHGGRLIYCNWTTEDCQTKAKNLLKVLREKDCRHCETPITDREREQTTLEKDIILLNSAEMQLKEYFAGRRKAFELPLQFHGTEFQTKVWSVLTTIKYGQTISYSQLSEMTGNKKGCRSVAGACGANPIAIVAPCHRVISSRGGKGGYTGGLDKKIFLLDLEKNLQEE